MKYTLTELDGVTKLEMNFADEGVALECETVVAGAPAEGQEYVPVFERDMRANFRHLFPLPDPEVAEGGEE